MRRLLHTCSSYRVKLPGSILIVLLFALLPIQLFSWTCTTQQLCTVPCYRYNQNVEIVALVVTTAPQTGNITSFTFNTAGTTSPLTTISNAKLWYTNSCPVIFSGCAAGNPIQYGATIAAPNGNMVFNGSTALNTGCVYYFWLTYDIQITAPIGNVVDAQCLSVTYAGTTQAPIVTTPAGSRTVNSPLPPSNIVQNGSFEGICPYTTGCSVLGNGLSEPGIAYPWYMPTGGSSDYQNCGTGAPLAFTPIPPPRTGNCTVGEYFYGFGGYREYVQAPLSRPLIPGNIYEVTYYVRLATPQAGCQVLNMSAAFTNGPSFNYASTTNMPLAPSITASSLTGSATQWSKVCGCFIATGNQDYVTIGNFNNDGTTTQVGCSLGYFFVDDVSVEDLTQTGNPPSCGTCTLLPIELISFNGACLGKGVELNWATASEHNNSFFQIEKSRDGVNYDFAGKVNSAGNSITRNDYSFFDEHAQAGITYYRLRETGLNNQFRYYDPIAVNCTGLREFKIQPNPNTGVFELAGAEKDELVIVRDIYGQTVISLPYSSPLDLSFLNKGIYFLHLGSANEGAAKKLVID